MMFLIQEALLVEDRFNGGDDVHAAIFFDEVFIHEFAEQFNRTSFDKWNRTSSVVNSFQVGVLKFTFIGRIIRGRLMRFLNDVTVYVIDGEISIFLDVRVGVSRSKTWTNNESN